MADGKPLGDEQLDPARDIPRLALTDGNQGAGQPAQGEPRLSLTDDVAVAPGSEVETTPAQRELPPGLEDLEARVRRLEEQYAALQDTRPLEERVVQRITSRLRRKPATMIREPEAAVREPDQGMTGDQAEAGPPPAVAAIAAAEESLAAIRLARQPTAPVATLLESPPEVPVAVTAPAQVAQVAMVVDAPVAALAPIPIAPSPPPRSGWRSWFVIQSLRQGLNNFRLFVRMYVDPRYHMTLLGRLVPLAFLFFLVFSDWDWRVFQIIFAWNLIPVFGPIINKLLLVLFAWVTVRVLGREMRRYQDTIPDVPEALRWTS
jgi:hypothetical protein